jgi:hypothetical protein
VVVLSSQARPRRQLVERGQGVRGSRSGDSLRGFQGMADATPTVEASRMKGARKYKNCPTVVDGIRFASKREALRYCELKLLQKAGEISNLLLQPRYPMAVGGLHVCTYVADFTYHDVSTKRTITEDSKGVRTKEFIIKAKLFHALYGREVVLV